MAASRLANSRSGPHFVDRLVESVGCFDIELARLFEQVFAELISAGTSMHFWQIGQSQR